MQVVHQLFIGENGKSLICRSTSGFDKCIFRVGFVQHVWDHGVLFLNNFLFLVILFIIDS